MENYSRIRFGPFSVDAAERVLRRDGQPVPLTPKAFDLLAALVEQPGRLLSKDELLRTVWPDTFVEESNLAYNVFALRKVLGDAAEGGQYIETVPKRGYRFRAAVTPVSPESDVWTTTESPAPSAPMAPAATPPGVTPRSSRWPRQWLLAIVLVLVAGWYLVPHPWRDAPAPEPLRALPLTSVPGVVRSPSLSPDGNYVAFTWSGASQDNPDIYIQQIGAGTPLRLTTDAGNDYSPGWSPDGRMIAFLRRTPSSATSEVRLIAPLGGPERKVADITPSRPPYRPISLAWCPDAACVIVPDGLGPKGPDALVLITIGTGAKHELTRSPAHAVDADPAVSPDGRWVVFRRDTTPFSGAFYRVALNARSERERQPVRLTATLSAGRPAWMGDNRTIVFAGRGALWKLDAQRGGAPMRMPFVGQDGSSPAIAGAATDRQRLVYVRSFSDTNLYRVDTEAPGAPASSPPRVAVASTRTDVIPNLSPDGRRLVFLSDRSGEPQLWVSDLDGANVVQLTTMTFHSSPGFPRWSPDGRLVTFHGDHNDRPDVVVMPVASGTPVIITANVVNGAFPSFSRDGRWIYFCLARPGRSRIWKMPTSGGEPVEVTQTTSTIAIESPDGRDLYYAENVSDSSALWRLPLEGGQAVKVLEAVAHGAFDVVDAGIYYVERVSGETGAFYADRPGGATRLRFFSFATQRSTTVADNLGTVGPGLSASRDGRRVFFSRVDAAVDELMVVEHFR